MSNIVVGIDGSPTSAHALRWAQREGRIRQEPVVAVMAWGLLNQRHPNRSQAFKPDYSETDALETLRSYVTDAVGPDATAEIELRTCNDLPDRALLGESTDASILVLGGRGLGGFRGMLLGSVSYHCLHHAACPVAIIRGQDAGPSTDVPQRVVVGIDGSATSAKALRWALEEASARYATLEVVHAWQGYHGEGGAYGLAVIDPDVFESSARDLLDDCVDGLDAADLSDQIQRTLVCDSPAHAILTVGKDADLVVLGSRGVGGFAGLLVGSTATQVAHHIDRPIVIVPGDR